MTEAETDRSPGVLGERRQALISGQITRQIARLAAFSGGEVGLFGLMPLILAYWAGHVSNDALAGVALGNSLYVVLTSVCRGASLAGMALIAQAIGAGDRARAERVLMQTLLLLAALCVALGVFGTAVGRVVLGWMGASGGLLDAAYAYLRAVMIGLLAMEALPCIDNIVRGAGHPEYTLLANLVAVLVMLLSTPLLVAGRWLGLGAAGAGWSAAVGSLAGSALLLALLWRGTAGVRLRAKALVPDGALLAELVRIGLPATAQRLSLNVGNALFMALITGLGKPVLVAYSVVNRVTGFLLCPVTGVGMATATLVGQNLGAGQVRRARQAIRQSTLVGVVSVAVLIGLLNVWPRPILRLFTRDGEAIRQGIVAARFMLYIGLASACNNTLSGGLTGAGDTLSPMAANLAAEYAVQLPIAWLLVRALPVGPLAIWIALAVGQTVAAAALGVVIKRGRWRRRWAAQRGPGPEPKA